MKSMASSSMGENIMLMEEKRPEKICEESCRAFLQLSPPQVPMSSSVIYDTHPHNINGVVKNGSSIVLEKSSSDRNHIQFSTAISEKPLLQHSANNLDYMDLEYKPTVPTVSQVDEVVTEKGSSNSFQQPSNLMRYHSAPSSFFATLAEEENNQIISQYFVNESPNAAGQVLKQAQPNHSRALNYQKMQDQPVKQLGEQSNYVPRSPSLKRSGGNIPRDDTVKHTLHAILEHVPDLPHESYNTSSLPMMTQAQVSQSSGQSLESYHQNPVCSNNLGRPGYPANDYSSMPKMSLIRHSSSPAGLLSELLTDQGSFECEYGEGAVKSSMEMINPARDAGVPNRAPRHMPCVRQNSSPSGFLSQLSRDAQAAEGQDRSPSDNGLVGTGNSSQGYIPKLPIESWGDGGASTNFAGLQNSTMFGSRKRARDFDEKVRQEMNQSEAQGYYPINLPRSASADLAMEDFMHEAVPCKVRAKRGCATHPRSIAERVRRTRISERMRKLQDLVPNSDKQTVNIADMLDEAVEYVKTLQKQVQELTDKKDKCTCMHKPDCEYKT